MSDLSDVVPRDAVSAVARDAGLIHAAPRPYANPYVAGVWLGLVLLTAFVIMGRGLGASGAFASAAAGAVGTVAPDQARANHYFARYLSNGGRPQLDWLAIEVLGVFVGGAISAKLAGRIRVTIERGPRIANRARLALALAGGALMGGGAVIARGCTSGLGLTGGATLSVGSWIFLAGAFGGAYGIAPLLRRAWT